MKRGKRSQIPSTVFVYAMAAVIIAFILIFGYKAIGTLWETSSATETAQFKNEMKKIISQRSSYGEDEIITKRLPMGYEALCFLSAETGPGVSADLRSEYPLSTEIAISTDNVFLADGEGQLDPFFVDDFELQNIAGNPSSDLCFEAVSREIRFRIRGRGDYALISPAE